MVAVGAARRPGMLRGRLAADRASRVPVGARAAGVAGAALRAVMVAVLAVRGLAGVALLAYGAWLAWEPAGFILVGLALLADRLHDDRRPEEKATSS